MKEKTFKGISSPFSQPGLIWTICCALSLGIISFQLIFRHARVSSTYPCMSVRPLVTLSDLSNRSASLVALREKLKREDPNYFCVFYESVFSESVFSECVFSESVPFKGVFSERVFPKVYFPKVYFQKCIFQKCIFRNGIFRKCIFRKCFFSERVFFESVLQVCKYFGSKLFWPKPYLAQPFSKWACPVKCVSSELLRACCYYHNPAQHGDFVDCV